MKVKFKYGIKSFSGTHDEMVFANYDLNNVVIGRMLPRTGEPTVNQIEMGIRLQKISELWPHVSSGYKADLEAYAKKYSLLPERTGKVGVNAFSIFVKVLFAAHNDSTTGFVINDISIDDLAIGAYTFIDNVADMVEEGYLPQVFGFELLDQSIVDE